MTTPQGVGRVVPWQRRPAAADFAGAVREARKILDEFGFSAPPINPVTIARELGVKVSFVSMPKHPNVSGFYDAQDYAIYVAKGEYPKRQTFTIAHELGHRLLHREWAAGNDYRVMLRDQSLMILDDKEQEANTFAAHLLVPRDMLDEYRHIASTEELSRLFMVSMPVIRNRLRREFGT
jgi:Zn-dependent peptidase ImmA (M78 family)